MRFVFQRCRSSPLVVLVCALAACGQDPVEPVSTASGIEISVSVDRDSVRGGDTLIATVAATNTGRRPVVLHGETGCRPILAVQVLAPGDSVWRGPPGVGVCFNRGRPPPGLRFEAGETLAIDTAWVAVRPLDGPVLAPGSYRLRGVIAVVRDSPKSDPVDVRVLPNLRLTLQAENGRVGPWDRVRVRATVTNLSSRRVTVPALDSCRFGLWVRRGGEVITRLTGCPLETREVQLPPGGEVEREFAWVSGPTGRYTLVGHLAAGRVQPSVRAELPLEVRP